MSGLRGEVRTILANDQAGGMAHLLSRMVLAYHLHGGKYPLRARISPTLWTRLCADCDRILTVFTWSWTSQW